MIKRNTWGRAVRRKPGEMNGLEARYFKEVLVPGVSNKSIIGFQFEAIKLKLAAKTFYEPDFLVIAADEVLEIHEVKGFWEDDARVKIKVAAAMFPFRFKAITWDREKKIWVEENFVKEEAA